MSQRDGILEEEWTKVVTTAISDNDPKKNTQSAGIQSAQAKCCTIVAELTYYT